jgi:hypothetical protein
MDRCRSSNHSDDDRGRMLKRGQLDAPRLSE